MPHVMLRIMLHSDTTVKRTGIETAKVAVVDRQARVGSAND